MLSMWTAVNSNSPRAQRRMMYISAAVFLALSVIGVRSISAFRL